MKKIPSLALTTLALCLCAGSLHAQTIYNSEQINSKIAYQNQTTNGISVQNLQSEQNESNFLQVKAQIHNNSSSNRHVYFRVRWMDNAGVQVGSNGSWKPVLLPPQKSQLVRDTAPSITATDFQIEINAE